MDFDFSEEEEVKIRQLMGYLTEAVHHFHLSISRDEEYNHDPYITIIGINRFASAAVQAVVKALRENAEEN